MVPIVRRSAYIRACMVLLCLLIFVSLIPLSVPQSVKATTSKISFQANSIPDVNVYYDDYSFVFEYKSFFIKIRPFIIYNGTFYSMRKIVTFLKNNYPNVNYSYIIDATINRLHYGYNLTNIPQSIADEINYVGFKLMDLNFPLSYLKLKKTLFMGEDFKTYNMTVIRVANKFSFSFEDLFGLGYSIRHVNKTYILIGNVTGKTDLHMDPFVYSGDTIYIWGGSEGSEIDSLNIWDADNTGGWGQVEKDSTNTSFTWHCKLFWGEDENGTERTVWFADEAVQWVFVKDAPQTIMEVSGHNNSHFRLGEVIDESLKIGDRGVDLIAKRDNTWSTIYFADGSDVELYSSRFYSKYDDSRLCIDTTFKMYGCTLDGWIYWQSWNTVSDVYRTIIKNTQYGIFSYTDFGSHEEMFIHSNDYGVRINTANITISNSVFRNNTIMFYAWKNVIDVNLTNIDSDDWSFYWVSPLVGGANFYRQYTFDLTITFQNTSYIENANVTISNDYLGTSDSWLTYANGSIPPQIYRYGHYNRTLFNAICDYNPYNITVTKDGLQTYTALFNTTKETDLTISLQEIPEGAVAFPVSWLMAGSTAGLILGCLIAITWISHARKEKEREDFILEPRRP